MSPNQTVDSAHLEVSVNCFVVDGHVNYHGRRSSDYENWGMMMGVSGRGGGDTSQAYHGSYGHHGQFGEFALQQY